MSDKINDKITLQLQELQQMELMDTEQLQALWHKHFKEPPRRLQRDLMVWNISYKIQEKAYGGLSKTVRNKLERLAFESQQQSQPKFTLSAGTKLVREWNGVQHVVTTTDSGFEYAGKPYRSLSKIAGEITGARWSGPLFFGLKKQEMKNDKAA